MKRTQTPWPSGIKKTRPRACVLGVLENASAPLSASQIVSQIEKSGDAIWLSTVYRILDLFVKQGIVVRLAVMNSDMAVYELNRFEHKHYAVCMGCRKIVPMDNCPLEAFVPQLDESGFHVLGHHLEIYGYCRDCEPK
ncbi:MAG: Fur family transcriptional regulator [Bacillota bacterium]